MNRSRRFALVREAMDMLSFTDAAINIGVDYRDRNGDLENNLEIERLEGHNVYRIVSRVTGALVVDPAESSQVMHDLRALIDRDFDITLILLVGWGWDLEGWHENGAWQDVTLYPGGEHISLPRRRQAINSLSNVSNNEFNQSFPWRQENLSNESNVNENENENE